MKKLLCCLATFLIAVSSLTAHDMKNCKCDPCLCTPEDHCGCHSEPSEDNNDKTEKDQKDIIKK